MRRFDLITDVVPCAASGRRYFTPEEANRSLVLVKRIVEDVITGYGRLLDLQEMIDAGYAGGATHQTEQFQDEIVHVAERLQVCAEELDDVGVILQDWAQGIVNFPCRIDGAEAMLSWRFGEPSVAHWHDLGAAFAERQPITGTFYSERTTVRQ